jgi:hypothetical protein
MLVSSQASGNIYLYPNPNSGQFQIRFDNQPNEKITVRIFDEKGSLVYTKVAVTTTAIQASRSTSVICRQHTYFVAIIGADGRLIGARKVSVRR